MLKKLKHVEKDLVLIVIGFTIFSIPYFLSTKFAGIGYPPASEIILLEYDWLVPPGEHTCYSYLLDNQEYEDCTDLLKSGWMSVGFGSKSVKFFVNISDPGVPSAGVYLRNLLVVLSASDPRGGSFGSCCATPPLGSI